MLPGQRYGKSVAFPEPTQLFQEFRIKVYLTNAI